MANLFAKKNKKYFICLELQDHSLRILKSVKKKNQLLFESFNSIDLPEGSIKFGRIHDKETMIKLLESIRQKIGLEAPKTALCIPNNFLIQKKINLNEPISKNEIENLIIASLKPELTDKDSFYYDYLSILGEKLKKLASQNITVFATQKQIIEERKIILQEAGFIPTIFDCHQQALARACLFLFKKFHPTHTPENFTIFNLEENQLDMIHIKKHQILYKNTFFHKITPNNYDLLLLINKSLLLFANNFSEESISKIVLVGKLSNNGEIINYFSDKKSIFILTPENINAIFLALFTQKTETSIKTSEAIACLGLALHQHWNWQYA